jgi:hypothetical protein|nr:MAG TPA: hypothetical protein [Caudoviricetes sp.]
MAEYLTNTADLTKVASAIREKSSISDPLVYPDGFVSAIQAIPQKTILLASNIAIEDGVLTFSVDRRNYEYGICNFMVIEQVANPIYKLVLWKNDNNSNKYSSINSTSNGYVLGTNFVTVTLTTKSVDFIVNTGDSGGNFYIGKMNVYGWSN